GPRFAPADVPRLKDIPGVLAEIPIVTRATLVRIHGKRVRSVLLGIPAEESEVWKALKLVEGVACTQPDEAIVAHEVAQSLKIALGDRITVLTRRGPRSAKAV